MGDVEEAGDGWEDEEELGVEGVPVGVLGSERFYESLLFCWRDVSRVLKMAEAEG